MNVEALKKPEAGTGPQIYYLIEEAAMKTIEWGFLIVNYLFLGGLSAGLVFVSALAACKAFANPTRLRILDMVGHRDHSAADLQKQLAISKANLSQHLAILKAAGVVVTRRNGKRVHCHLAIPEVKKACALIRKVLRAQIRNGRDLNI